MKKAGGRGRKDDSGKTADTSRKVAWAMYFQTSRELHEALVMLRDLMNDSDVAPLIPTHVSTQYRDLVVKYDQGERECPICPDPITLETSHLTDCGHLFHYACIKTTAECPVCRGKYRRAANWRVVETNTPRPGPPSSPSPSPPSSPPPPPRISPIEGIPVPDISAQMCV